MGAIRYSVSQQCWRLSPSSALRTSLIYYAASGWCNSFYFIYSKEPKYTKRRSSRKEERCITCRTALICVCLSFGGASTSTVSGATSNTDAVVSVCFGKCSPMYSYTGYIYWPSINTNIQARLMITPQLCVWQWKIERVRKRRVQWVMMSSHQKGNCRFSMRTLSTTDG